MRKPIAVYEMANKITVQAKEDPEFCSLWQQAVTQKLWAEWLFQFLPVG